MSNKEFYVRHGLVVNNTVLTANVITNNVGIGTNNAAYTLDVIGNANISLPQLFVAGTNVLATLNSAYTIVNASYNSGNSNWAVQNAIYDLTNTVYNSANSNWVVQNNLYLLVNSTYSLINTGWATQNGIYDLVNTAYNSGNSNWIVQNAVYDLANTIYASSNSNWQVQNTLYATTNAAYDMGNAAYATINADYAFTNSAYASINSNWTVMNVIYSTVNADYTMSNAAYVALNSAYDTVNAVYASGNSNWVVQNAIYDTVNSVYFAANTEIAKGYLRLSNSSTILDGATGNVWGGSFSSTLKTTWGGFYNSNNSTALFTFASGAGNVMSVQMDGSLFVGESFITDAMGVLPSYGGWIVAASGIKSVYNIYAGNDLGAAANVTVGSYVSFPDGTLQNTAFTPVVFKTINAAFATVNAVYASSNSNWVVQNAVYDLTNTVYNSSNSNWVVQNAIYDLVNTAYNSGNSNWVVQNAVYDLANTIYASGNSNWVVQNNLYTLANTIYASSNSNWVVQNVIYDLANTIYASENSNWTVQNALYQVANAAFLRANALVNVGQTSPAGPVLGNLWWDTDVGKLFIYYTDADSSQWVEVEPSGTSGTTPGSGSANMSYAGAVWTGANVALANSSQTYIVPISSVASSSDVVVDGNNSILFSQNKTYILTFSIQFENPDNAQNDIYVWLMQNGQNLTDSASAFTIAARKNPQITGKLIATTPIMFTAVNGDYIQVKAACPTSNLVSIVTYPATNNNISIPRTPGVIVNITQAS